VRVNAVSPTVVTEALDQCADSFPGFEPVPLERVPGIQLVDRRYGNRPSHRLG
jgi:hypothetical protein